MSFLIISSARTTLASSDRDSNDSNSIRSENLFLIFQTLEEISDKN